MQILLRILFALVTAKPERIEQRIAFALHHFSDDVRLHEIARALPDVATPDWSESFVDAAIAAQTPRVPASLLVALGWGESRFDTNAQPACGVMQVFPHDLGEPPSACAHWRKDLRAGVEAGVREIEMMLADKRVHGNMTLALFYRACGNSAFDGTCDANKPEKRVWVATAMARWHDIAARSSRDLIPGV